MTTSKELIESISARQEYILNHAVYRYYVAYLVDAWYYKEWPKEEIAQAREHLIAQVRRWAKSEEEANSILALTILYRGNTWDL